MNNLTIAELEDALPISQDDYLPIFQQEALNPSGFPGDTRKFKFGSLHVYGIGDGYTQGPNDRNPFEKGLPGHWEVWNHRAEWYGFSDTAPVFVNYQAGGNYAANTTVMYHINGSHWKLYRAKEAIDNAPLRIETVKWDELQPSEGAWRRHVQPGDEGWLKADLQIGDEILEGPFAGKFVTEVLVRGGTFPSWAGGNRPTYENGVQQGRIINITGPVGLVGTNRTNPGLFIKPPFFGETQLPTHGFAPNQNDQAIWHSAIDLSLVVKTGTDVAGENWGELYWRRVS